LIADEEKPSGLPSLPFGYLDQIKAGGETAFQQDMAILSSDVIPKPDLSISYKGPLHRSKRPDTLGWLSEFGILKGDQFSLFVDAGQIQQTYSCTVTSFQVEDLSPGKPLKTKKGEHFSHDHIVVFSKDRRVHLSFSSHDIAQAWIQAFQVLMITKYPPIVIKAKDEVIEKYQLLWLYQLNDCSWMKSQFQAELLAEAGVSIPEKKYYQSYVSYRHQSIFEGGPQKKEKLYAMLTAAGISLVRKRDPGTNRISVGTLVPTESQLAEDRPY